MTFGHIIRRATADDLCAIQCSARLAYEKYVSRIGKAPAPMVADFQVHISRNEIYVIEVDGNVVGYAVFYPRNEHLHLENVALRPEHAGRGLGRALIEFAEKSASAHGLAAVELYTNEKMYENLSMYPTLGYQEIGRRIEDGFRRVYFRKTL